MDTGTMELSNPTASLGRTGGRKAGGSPSPAPGSADTLVQREVGSPIGPLQIVAGPAGLRAVLWPREQRPRLPRTWLATTGEGESSAGDPRTRAHLDRAQLELAEYFAGTRREFGVGLDPVGTPFQLRAWQVLRTIPFAATSSYGEQARALGDPNLARAVGGANARNPISIIVPCHRVVSARGDLTGFAGGLEVKAWLLAHEQAVARHWR